MPLLRLAELTSLVVLAVFALVNLSLYVLGGTSADATLRRWRYWGLVGAMLALAIIVFQLWQGVLAAH